MNPSDAHGFTDAALVGIDEGCRTKDSRASNPAEAEQGGADEAKACLGTIAGAPASPRDRPADPRSVTGRRHSQVLVQDALVDCREPPRVPPSHMTRAVCKTMEGEAKRRDRLTWLAVLTLRSNPRIATDVRLGMKLRCIG